jgi:hypothetical protein
MANAPDLPAPDDVRQSLLELVFGPNSVIVWVYVLVVFAFSWFKAARSASTMAGKAYVHLKSREVPQRTRIIWNGVATIVTQSLYLLLGYFIAVELAVLLGLREGVALPDYKEWMNIPGTASWDPFTGSYFTISIVIVLASHVCAAKGWTTGPLRFFAIPGFFSIVLLIIAGFGALMGQNDGDPQYTTERVWSYWIVLGVVIVYLLLYFAALSAPKRFYASWRSVPSQS